MGAVFRAVDESTGRVIALKRLLSSSNTHVGKLFEREYRTLSQLQHPRIIEVYDYGIDEDGAYYTMELLEGADLRDLAPLPYRDVCRLVRDIASSLALLHARRLLHRDISPRNIRLSSDGRPKLIDFGALTTFGACEQIVGTPPGVPPEALHGLDIDQRSDLYSLGALCYWMLTKRHAYPARDLSQLPGLWKKGSPDPLSELAPDVPTELEHLVLRLLSADPLARPTSAAEVIEHLEIIGELEAEEPVEAGASYLVNPRLIGRERELRALRNMDERLQSGRTAAVIVEGAAGVGKTRLLSELTLKAQMRGATVLRVDAELHRGPYGVVHALARALLTKVPHAALESARPYVDLIGHIVPELSERSRVSELPPLPKDRGERRVRLQSALCEWIVAISKTWPLVVMVDNAHEADESSLALFATLPRLAPQSPIVLLFEERTDQQPASPRAFQTLHECCGRIALGGLDLEHTTELVHALFGNVNNAGRLGLWLYERTGGNPMQCVTLARQLIDQKLIQYVNGAWTLPLELADDALPVDMRAVFEGRISKLTPSGRKLAECLSVSRGTLSLEQCLAISNMSDAETFSALADLVAQEILVLIGEDYRFRHNALRAHLFASLPTARQQLLHRRAGDFLLEQGGKDVLSRIDAGWHLLRGGEATRGAEILAEVGQRLVSTIEGLSFAAPALEAALEVFDREKRSPWVILPVLDALTSAGWYVDRKYAEKYGERTLNLALELTGLKAAEKLSRVVGPKMAVKLGTAAAAVRHRREKQHIRTKALKNFSGVFGPLIASLGCLIGVAANCMDAAAARRVLGAVRMMSAFEEGHIVSVMYEYARYYTLTAEGRLAEAEPIGMRVLEWMRSPAAVKALRAEGARALSGGIMTGLSHYAVFRDDDSALKWADELESLGLSFYRMMSNEARFMYHVYRGEMGRARPFRDRLELNAIQGGTTWQSSITLPLTLSGVYAYTGDLVGMRQALGQLEGQAAELESLSTMAVGLRSLYELQRGRVDSAVAMMEPAAKTLLDRNTPFWALVATKYAGGLIAARRVEEAQSILDAVKSKIAPGDEAYTFLYLERDIQQANLDAAAGRVQAARRRLDSLIEEHGKKQGPLTLFRLHEAGARLALDCADTAALAKHMPELERWARYAENPALVAKFKRLENQVLRSSEPQSRIRFSGSRTDTYASAARSLLQAKDPPERANAALRIAVERSGARGGFLYAGRPSDFHLVAGLPQDEVPPLQVLERLSELANNVQGTCDFFSATQVKTATLEAPNAIAPGSDGPEDLHLELLLLPSAAGSLIVGALVLKPTRNGFLPLGFELLEAVAEALYGLADYSAGTRIEDDFAELFDDA